MRYQFETACELAPLFVLTIVSVLIMSAMRVGKNGGAAGG
jgi:hypothetical protein